MHKDVEIVTENDGKKIVRINKIKFKGKRAVNDPMI